MRLALAAATIWLLPTVASAQTINPPGSIDLTVKIADKDGKPVKNFSEKTEADPDCKSCSDLTVGWVLSEALGSRICPPPQTGRPEVKPPECTADEEKIEADGLQMAARTKAALDMRTAPHLVLGKKSLDTLRNLFLGRWKQAPQIVLQVWPLLDPSAPIPEFGKD